jgi:hypothetical protein
MNFAHRVYVCVKVCIILRINIISINSANNFDIKLLMWLIIPHCALKAHGEAKL